MEECQSRQKGVKPPGILYSRLQRDGDFCATLTLFLFRAVECRALLLQLLRYILHRFADVISRNH